MRYAGCLAAAALMIAGWALAAAAEPLLRPTPDLGPREVLSAQLKALQHNDTPYANAGIAQTWAPAHPGNQRATGPLSRFTEMLKSPLYRPLLDHHAHSVEVAEQDQTHVTFIVMIEDRAGHAVAYEWTVERITEGDLAGCWLTTMVSPPVPLGDVI